MLLAVRDFIRLHGRANNEQLSREFRIAKDALEPILEICVSKGLIRVLNPKRSCGRSCRSCLDQAINEYEWIK